MINKKPDCERLGAWKSGSKQGHRNISRACKSWWTVFQTAHNSFDELGCVKFMLDRIGRDLQSLPNFSVFAVAPWAKMSLFQSQYSSCWCAHLNSQSWLSILTPLSRATSVKNIVLLELRWMTFEQASRGEEIHLRGHPFIVSFLLINSTQHDVKQSN